MTLLEFVHLHILNRADSAQYACVADAPWPKGLVAMFNMDMFLAEASEPVRMRYNMEQDIAVKLRSELPSGRWKIVGRSGQGIRFEEVHPKFFESCDFNLPANTAGRLNQGFLLQGYRDLTITTDDAGLAHWKMPENKKKVSEAVAEFLNGYANGDGPKRTAKALHEECVGQLGAEMNVHPGSLTFRSFQTKFAKLVPAHRKHEGAPRK